MINSRKIDSFTHSLFYYNLNKGQQKGRKDFNCNYVKKITSIVTCSHWKGKKALLREIIDIIYTEENPTNNYRKIGVETLAEKKTVITCLMTQAVPFFDHRRALFIYETFCFKEIICDSEEV